MRRNLQTILLVVTLNAGNYIVGRLNFYREEEGMLEYNWTNAVENCVRTELKHKNLFDLREKQEPQDILDRLGPQGTSRHQGALGDAEATPMNAF